MNKYQVGDMVQATKNKNTVRIITEVNDTSVDTKKPNGTPQRISYQTLETKYKIIGNTKDEIRDAKLKSKLINTDCEIEEYSDKVNHPSHYNTKDIECIDWIKLSLTSEEYCGFLKGNIEKYLYRYQDKGETEDLNKAKWYLDKLIEETS